MGGVPLRLPTVPGPAARSSQSNPRGSWPEVLKRERGHVTAKSGVSEVGVFRALQPNARFEPSQWETVLLCNDVSLIGWAQTYNQPWRTWGTPFISEYCTACAPGTFNSGAGATECDTCDTGYFSAAAKDRCEICPPDTYSLDGTCVTCGGAHECACSADVYPCDAVATCHNTANDGVSYVCGACPPGFVGDGTTCDDIDEVWHMMYLQ